MLAMIVKRGQEPWVQQSFLSYSNPKLPCCCLNCRVGSSGLAGPSSFMYPIVNLPSIKPTKGQLPLQTDGLACYTFCPRALSLAVIWSSLTPGSGKEKRREGRSLGPGLRQAPGLSGIVHPAIEGNPAGQTGGERGQVEP